MSTPTKKTAAAKTADAPEPVEKVLRSAGPKMLHVLYCQLELVSGDPGLSDVLIFGRQNEAWKALATTHTGERGWKYVAVEVGASVADAIAKAGA